MPGAGADTPLSTAFRCCSATERFLPIEAISRGMRALSAAVDISADFGTGIGAKKKRRLVYTPRYIADSRFYRTMDSSGNAVASICVSLCILDAEGS